MYKVTDEKDQLMRKIKALREKNNLTQRALAAECGVPQAVIARLEAGQTNPQVDTVYKMLAVFGKTLDIVSYTQPPEEYYTSKVNQDHVIQEDKPESYGAKAKKKKLIQHKI